MISGRLAIADRVLVLVSFSSIIPQENFYQNDAQRVRSFSTTGANFIKKIKAPFPVSNKTVSDDGDGVKGDGSFPAHLAVSNFQ